MKKCFEKCGHKADKSEKVVDCQTECVSESVISGRSRSSVGPRGEPLLLDWSIVIFMNVARFSYPCMLPSFLI